ncbi:hypothetical protein ABFV99_13930 [Cytobacillus horneckiae]|uniref:hypothetical protein n=1 Tax=Cytobacillus horneckiae TaxID=549687 RepID=UPI0034CE1EAB
MARNDANTNRPKNQKPANEKHKTVYFNTKNQNDAALFKYAESVGVRNFSGFVKSLIYQEMIRRDGQAPNPYEYATIPMNPIVEDYSEEVETTPRTVRVPVRRTANTRQSTVREEAEEEVKVIVSGKELPKVKEPEEEQEELPVEDFVDSNEDIVDEQDTDEVDEEVEEESSSSRAQLAKGLIGAFKRN